MFQLWRECSSKVCECERNPCLKIMFDLKRLCRKNNLSQTVVSLKVNVVDRIRTSLENYDCCGGLYRLRSALSGVSKKQCGCQAAQADFRDKFYMKNATTATPDTKSPLRTAAGRISFVRSVLLLSQLFDVTVNNYAAVCKHELSREHCAVTG